MTGNRAPQHPSRRGPSSDPYRHAAGRSCLLVIFAVVTLAWLLGSLGGSGWVM